MKTVGFRSFALYILLFAFLGGLGWLGFNLVVHGSQWAMQPYNGHIYDEDATVVLGDISDRDGAVLAANQEGRRVYSESETQRRALLHTVGDPAGYISTSVQYTMRTKRTGYNLVTGLNDTVLNRLGYDVGERFMDTSGQEYTEEDLTFYWTEEDYQEFLQELKEFTDKD